MGTPSSNDGDPTKLKFIKDSAATNAVSVFIHYFGVSTS